MKSPLEIASTWHIQRVPPVFLTLLLILASGCSAAGVQTVSEEDSALALPTATPIVHEHFLQEWSVPPSIDELVYSSTRIVEATLLSVRATTETISNGVGVAPTYRPTHELRFTVLENLKGSGSVQVLVVVRGEHTYPTYAAAQAAADSRLLHRTTKWDDRTAILFLDANSEPYVSSSPATSQSEDVNEFVLLNFGRSNWDYSIEEISRAWLPAKDVIEGSGATAATASTTQFITHTDVLPLETITKSALQSNIAAMAQRLLAGKDVLGFRECLSSQFGHERHRRAVPWSPYEVASTLASGSAEGAEVYRWTLPEHAIDIYLLPWLSGADSARFQHSIVDEDTAPQTGYSMVADSTRPFPSGVYEFKYNIGHPNDVPCNTRPLDAYDLVTVTVSPPSGTLHEAFFDPVAVGNAVLADGTHGVLEPQNFTDTNGAPASIEKIAWESGTVTVGMTAHDAINGHTLDFIELDGSVSLSLDVTAATVDQAGNTLSWSVAAQPWEDGDLLMIRIRESPTPAPPVDPTAVQDLSISSTGLVTWRPPQNVSELRNYRLRVQDCSRSRSYSVYRGTGSLSWQIPQFSSENRYRVEVYAVYRNTGGGATTTEYLGTPLCRL